MHFRIFIPSDHPRATADPKDLINVGLSHLATGFHCVEHLPRKGVLNEKAGVIYFWPRPGDQKAWPDDVNFDWVPAKEFEGLPAGRYMVGFNPDSPPTPKELSLPIQVQGEAIWLGRALTTWVIPDVLFLPARVLLSGNTVRMERLARYQGRTVECGTWTKDCEEFLAMLRKGKADGDFEVDWRRAWEFCLTTLQINYRMPVEVAERLDLLTTDRISVILLSAIGAYEIARTADRREPEPMVIPGEFNHE